MKAYANTYFILGGDKEDVIQEGMLGLFFAVRDYREELSGFETFAHRCIKARILTALRLAKGKKHERVIEEKSDSFRRTCNIFRSGGACKLVLYKSGK